MVLIEGRAPRKHGSSSSNGSKDINHSTKVVSKQQANIMRLEIKRRKHSAKCKAWHVACCTYMLASTQQRAHCKASTVQGQSKQSNDKHSQTSSAAQPISMYLNGFQTQPDSDHYSFGAALVSVCCSSTHRLSLDNGEEGRGAILKGLFGGWSFVVLVAKLIAT